MRLTFKKISMKLQLKIGRLPPQVSLHAKPSHSCHAATAFQEPRWCHFLANTARKQSDGAECLTYSVARTMVKPSLAWAAGQGQVRHPKSVHKLVLNKANCLSFAATSLENKIYPLKYTLINKNLVNSWKYASYWSQLSRKHLQLTYFEADRPQVTQLPPSLPILRQDDNIHKIYSTVRARERLITSEKSCNTWMTTRRYLCSNGDF